MADDQLKAIIILKDDYTQIQQKMISEINIRIANEKHYQLDTLYNLSEKQQELDKEYAVKVKDTIEKYKGLGSQIFLTQQDIITGRRKEANFSKDERQDLDRYYNPNNPEDQKSKNDRFASNEVLPINQYWFFVFKNFDLVKPYIKDKDELILKHLHNIIVNIADEQSFEIKFEFKENEYFQNQYLVKTFFLNSEFEPRRSKSQIHYFQNYNLFLFKAEGSLIEWFEGKDVCRKTVKKSQKNRKTGAIRIITHEVEDESFFNFFNSINMEEVDLMGQRKEGSLIAQNKFLDRMNTDYDIARAIIDELQPYSLEYYLDVRRIRPKHSEVQDLSFLDDIKENTSSSSESSDQSDNDGQNQDDLQKDDKKKKGGKKNDKYKQSDKNNVSMLFGEKKDDCQQY